MLPALAEKFWGLQKFRLLACRLRNIHICHHRLPYRGRATHSFERLSWLEFEGNRGSAKCQHGTVRPKRVSPLYLPGCKAILGAMVMAERQGEENQWPGPRKKNWKIIYILPFPKGKLKVLL